MHHVFIVVLNWNGLNDTQECLSSVYGSDYKDFEVIVVDNHSQKDELAVIKQKYPSIVDIQSQINLGFTGGCNLGIKYALQNEAEYVWLLNNDAIVFPNTLKILIDKMNSSATLGMVSPVIYDKKSRELLYCGTLLESETLEQKNIKSVEDMLACEEMYPLKISLWGTALLIRRSLIEKVGYLDDRYFAYFEDMDYSHRTIANGFRNSIATEAMIFHAGNNRKRKPYFYFYMTRNNFLFIRKNSLKEQKFANISKCIAKVFKAVANKNNKGEIEEAEAYLDGIWNAFLNHYGEWINRKRIPKIFSNLFLHHPYFSAALIGHKYFVKIFFR